MDRRVAEGGRLHREHLATEVLAPALGLLFDFEVLLFRNVRPRLRRHSDLYSSVSLAQLEPYPDRLERDDRLAIGSFMEQPTRIRLLHVVLGINPVLCN